MVEINEGSDGSFSVPIVGAAGAAEIPSTARYRIDDAGTGNPVRAWASLTAASPLTVPILPADTAILVSTNDVETRVVTLELNHGTDTQWTTEWVYIVRNLRFFP